MAEAEFNGTPGDWKVLDGGGDWSADGPGSFTNMFVGVDGREAPIAILVERGVFRADDRIEANAALIAAAKPLLSAAQLVRDAFAHAPDGVIAGAFGDDVLAAVQACRSAIAKALGSAA